MARVSKSYTQLEQAVWIESFMRVSGRYRQYVGAEEAQPKRALTAVFGGDVEFSHTVTLRIKKPALPLCPTRAFGVAAVLILQTPILVIVHIDKCRYVCAKKVP